MLLLNNSDNLFSFKKSFIRIAKLNMCYNICYSKRPFQLMIFKRVRLISFARCDFKQVMISKEQKETIELRLTNQYFM